MSSVLTSRLAQLSEKDKQVFEELSYRLKQVDGDMTQLGAADIKLIQTMEQKYAETINQVSQNKKQPTPTLDILTTPFAQQVRQIIARELGAKFPLEEDAIAFIFENKWLPLDCQDERLAEDFFKDFELDINQANQWQEDLAGSTRDHKLALGLAWFMVIFQMNKRLSE